MLIFQMVKKESDETADRELKTHELCAFGDEVVSPGAGMGSQKWMPSLGLASACEPWAKIVPGF